MERALRSLFLNKTEQRVESDNRQNRRGLQPITQKGRERGRHQQNPNDKIAELAQ